MRTSPSPFLSLSVVDVMPVSAAVVSCGLPTCVGERRVPESPSSCSDAAGMTMTVPVSESPRLQFAAPPAVAVFLDNVHTKMQPPRSSGHDDCDSESARRLFECCLYYHLDC